MPRFYQHSDDTIRESFKRNKHLKYPYVEMSRSPSLSSQYTAKQIYHRCKELYPNRNQVAGHLINNTNVTTHITTITTITTMNPTRPTPAILEPNFQPDPQFKEAYKMEPIFK